MPFYKVDNGTLLVGANNIENRDYVLEAYKHAEYTYPVDGWFWFDTDEEAQGHFVKDETP